MKEDNYFEKKAISNGWTKEAWRLHISLCKQWKEDPERKPIKLTKKQSDILYCRC